MMLGVGMGKKGFGPGGFYGPGMGGLSPSCGPSRAQEEHLEGWGCGAFSPSDRPRPGDEKGRTSRSLCGAGQNQRQLLVH